MEVSEAINRKIKLEHEIKTLIEKFEEETGTKVSYINFSRIDHTELGKENESFSILGLGVVL